MLLEGIFLPLTTPFQADGRMYVGKLRGNVEHYSLTPAQGMVVLSDVGEADALTDEETRVVLSEAIAAAAPEKVMIAGVGRESVLATLALSEAAASAGYDAVAVRAPRFAGDAAMAVELMTYFRAVADGAALPVVLVSEAGRELSVDAIAQLAGHPQVIGLIDGEAGAERVREVKARTVEVSREVVVTTVFAAVTRRMQAAARIAAASGSSLGGVAVLEARPGLKTRGKRVSFQVLASSTARMLESWQAGAAGAVPRLGACAPQACCEVWQAFRDGDEPLAEEKQERVRGAARLMEGPAGIGAIKYGCDFNGYYGGRPRLPLLGLTAAGCAEVERELAGMRN